VETVQSQLREAMHEPLNLTPLFQSLEEYLGRRPTWPELNKAVFGYQFRGGLVEREEKMNKTIEQLKNKSAKKKND